MKTEYLYILERGSKKFLCPHCGKRSFVRYIDTETREYLSPQYGRCDRESKCAYHLNPYLDGYLETINKKQLKVISVKQKYFHTRPGSKNGCNSKTLQKTAYFGFEDFKKTLQPEGYEKNTFIQNLLYQVRFPFKADEVTKVIELYRLGTITEGYRTGAVTFPFIDFEGNIRTVQVKQFDKENHTIGTDFLHSIIEKQHLRAHNPLPNWLNEYSQNEKKVSCLFGEHLLKKYPLNPVALVEAPKTAVYGSLYFGFPEQSSENLIWLAVYNKSSFSMDKLKVLQGREVFIFPDLSKNGNTYKEWKSKAMKIERALPGTLFIFSDLLERLASEKDKNNGYDLADYLVQQDWRLFRKQLLKEKKENVSYGAEPLKTTDLVKPLVRTEPLIISSKKPDEKKNKKYPETWSKEIEALENFFSDVEIPDHSLQLNSCSSISDIPKFIKNHFSVVKANNGNPIFLPYLNRLQELKNRITLKN